jgi:hypothetical protein
VTGSRKWKKSGENGGKPCQTAAFGLAILDKRL